MGSNWVTLFLKVSDNHIILASLGNTFFFRESLHVSSIAAVNNFAIIYDFKYQ